MHCGHKVSNQQKVEWVYCEGGQQSPVSSSFFFNLTWPIYPQTSFTLLKIASTFHFLSKLYFSIPFFPPFHHPSIPAPLVSLTPSFVLYYSPPFLISYYFFHSPPIFHPPHHQSCHVQSIPESQSRSCHQLKQKRGKQTFRNLGFTKTCKHVLVLIWLLCFLIDL